MTTEDTAFKMLDATIGGIDDVRAATKALVRVAAARGFLLDTVLSPMPSASKTAEEMQAAAKILEDNDVAVGRRQFWGFRGGAR